VDLIIVDHFILPHYQHQTAVTISQVLGLPMIRVIARHLENAQWVKVTVIATMTALLDSPVDQTTVASFIQLLKAVRTVATTSQVLGRMMIAVIAQPQENAQRDKVTVIAMLSALLDSPVEQTTVILSM